MLETGKLEICDRWYLGTKGALREPMPEVAYLTTAWQLATGHLDIFENMPKILLVS